MALLSSIIICHIHINNNVNATINVLHAMNRAPITSCSWSHICLKMLAKGQTEPAPTSTSFTGCPYDSVVDEPQGS